MYIDFHAHIFPDQLAQRSIPALEQKGKVKAKLDGTLSSLLRSMDEASIERSVICSIATRPPQFESILDWSRNIRSDRILPLPSVHPDDPLLVAHLDRIGREGFLGIKMHPYYQEFAIDEERMYPVYEKLCKENMIVVMHTGYDIGFPKADIASPARIARIVEKFPDLLLVTTHCGAWKQWQEVRHLLLGRSIYMDISFSLDFMSREEAKSFLEAHDQNFLLFGSDSPWADQKRAIRQLKDLGLEEEREEKILSGNARRLLVLRNERKGEAGGKKGRNSETA